MQQPRPTATRTTASLLAMTLAASGLLSGGVGTAHAVQVGPEQEPAPARARAAQVYAAMTPAERVGQLFMVGVPSTGSTAAQRRTLRRLKVGNLYLAGATTARRAVLERRVNRAARAASSAGVRPFVSVDQEGGQVQRLAGRGFSRIPSALHQGRLPRAKLRAAHERWAGELRAAGVTVNLAPVADVVPARRARSNPPIGRYDRQFGHTAARVGRSTVAAVRGMREGGVAPTLKHFPGLGRASANTDFAQAVTDPTARGDRYLAPFRRGIDAGAPLVMVSSATYPRIDARRPACFSPTVLRGMLRRDLGFEGVVVSDDFDAVALAGTKPGTRATRFLGAGGTMVLVTSIRSVAAMTKAVRARQRADTEFAARVRGAVLTVLEVKAQAGLLR